jgi:cytosine/adenosine deaminase-related metal-dependent hydrolase
MTSSLIRGRHVICKITGPASSEVIPDGAVVQRDGVIVEVGPYAALQTRYAAYPVVGSQDHVVFPGLVNDHFHVGLSPFQLGAPDLPLELWSFARLGTKAVDPYLDHLYGAMLMMQSGTTTVQVLPTILRHALCDVRGAEEVLRAYRDAGMRLSYGITAVNQNAFIAGPQGGDNEFLAELPDPLAQRLRAVVEGARPSTAEIVDAADAILRQFGGDDPRVRVVLAPSNVHRCSDELLTAFKELAVRHRANLHIHLQETVYQKAYGLRQWGKTPLAHLHDLGFLGPDVTCAHAVWLTEGDIDLLEATGTGICHNASSNLRLQSGIAPVGRLLERGIRVALGSDEAGVNDDKDLLQEMRLVLKLHRVPGLETTVPTSYQVLQMATVNGARAAGYEDAVGTLEPGKRADMVLLRTDHLDEAYLDERVSVVDAVVHRGRGTDVDTVLVDGAPVIRNGVPTRFDRDKLLAEIWQSLARPPQPHERERRELGRVLEPYLRRFYAAAEGLGGAPHTSYNAR